MIRYVLGYVTGKAAKTVDDERARIEVENAQAERALKRALFSSPGWLALAVCLFFVRVRPPGQERFLWLAGAVLAAALLVVLVQRVGGFWLWLLSVALCVHLAAAGIWLAAAVTILIRDIPDMWRAIGALGMAATVICWPSRALLRWVEGQE